MHVLEARFYPASKSGPTFVTFGRVIFGGDRVSVEKAQVAAGAVKPFDIDRLHHQLEALVSSSIDPFHDLVQSRSLFWSFVEIRPSTRDAR